MSPNTHQSTGTVNMAKINSIASSAASIFVKIRFCTADISKFGYPSPLICSIFEAQTAGYKEILLFFARIRCYRYPQQKMEVAD